jgi:hypothetical protein
MDGTMPPRMKTGKYLPLMIEDIDNGKITINDYFYTPKSHLFAFLVCNNLKRKQGAKDDTIIFPYDNGLIYDWTPSPSEMYSFFPFVSRRKGILSEKKYWNKVSTYGNPYRKQ